VRDLIPCFARYGLRVAPDVNSEHPNDQDRERVEREDWAQHDPDAPETENESEREAEPSQDDNPARR